MIQIGKNTFRGGAALLAGGILLCASCSVQGVSEDEAPLVYTITYSKNGATAGQALIPADPVTITLGVEVTDFIFDEAIQKTQDGKLQVLRGWNTKNDGGGVFYGGKPTFKAEDFEGVADSGNTKNLPLYVQWSGTGLPDDPYIITNQGQLAGIKDDLAGNYRIVRNFPVTGEWKPLQKTGEPYEYFSGRLDGAYHTIEFMEDSYIEPVQKSSASPYDTGAGIFTYIKGGTVENLIITGKLRFPMEGRYAAGVIAASLDGGTTVSNCRVDADVTVAGGQAIGGIAGSIYNFAVIKNSSVAGKIVTSAESSVYYLGGLVGYSSDGVITNCYSTCDIEAASVTYVGGIAGEGQGTSGTGNSAIFTAVYASGRIAAGSGNAAGICYDAILNTEIHNSVALNPSLAAPNVKRVFKGAENADRFTNNYALSTMTGATWTSKGAGKQNGADVTEADAQTETWWKNTLGWSDRFGGTGAKPWVWDDIAKRPVLYWE